MLSHDYKWNKKKKIEQDGLELKIKIWPMVVQYNREAGLSVCFDLPFIGSAGGSPDLDSFTRSLACSLIN